MRFTVFAVAGFSMLAACGDLPDPAADEPDGPDVEVSSRDLAAAYAENEVAANQAYGNSALVVSGTVETIELDMMDEPTIQLPGTDDFTSVHVSFEGDATEATAQLSKGQEVTVRCKSVSEIMGSPMLDDCSLQ